VIAHHGVYVTLPLNLAEFFKIDHDPVDATANSKGCNRRRVCDQKELQTKLQVTKRNRIAVWPTKNSQ
jgi:hypothetical protein